jgi:hypothetical protein
LVRIHIDGLLFFEWVAQFGFRAIDKVGGGFVVTDVEGGGDLVF